MNDSEYNELQAASWRRPLTPAEEGRLQAYLAIQPAAQAAWEEDLALTRQLRELTDAPVPSNFTSLVWQAIEADMLPRSSRGAAKFAWSGWLRRFAPRIAVAALALLLGVTGLQYRHSYTRKQVARDVGVFVVANLPLPGPEVFADFEAIQKLQPVLLSSDDDLLAALR